MLLPRTEDEVRLSVLDAISGKAPIRICGAGTWADAGAPVDTHTTLALRDLSGIIAYVPGDLTITAWAGTTLAELRHATAGHGQWLGLDPAGDRMGTIGATIATASSGPLAHAFGTPRDLVLGLDAVTGYGELVRPGGRVVKNVAGFDLVRLYTGAWGTLGAITSVTLRLRARPVHDVTLVLPAGDARRLSELVPLLRRHTLSLLACEWLDGATARALGISQGDDVVLVRLGGNDAFVRGQRAVLDGFAPSALADPAIWDAIAMLDADAAVVIRFTGSVSTLAARIDRLRASCDLAGARVAVHASLARGAIRVIVSGETQRIRAALQPATHDPNRIVERLPAAWWAAEPDPFSGGLAGRVRAAFDPHQLCNRRSVADA